ncbi:MAG TPA: molybdenum cofactor guanylyltransferase [Candidatus Eremiobacteraeota bacterium]|nr:molybdenum cofactor guanylyltransferase [Candidatus Eremiobacteraeota bacterium]
MKKYDTTAGAILVGGHSRRMGKNKAFIEIGGKPIIERTINILKDIFKKIIIVADVAEKYSLYKKDCLVVSDIIKDIGPLGGIHAALSYSEKDSVFFVACDMPYLKGDIIRKQLDYFHSINCDILIPRIKDSIEPLHCIYRKIFKERIDAYVKTGEKYAMRRLFHTVNTHYWEIEDTSFYKSIFMNLNTPEDLANFIENPS